MSNHVLDDAPLTSFHKKLALYSSGGPLLDGYILSIIGIAMVQITPQLNMTPTWAGLLGASALIGIFLGGALGGYLTDRFGRQVLYTVDLIAIIGCSVAQFWATDVVWLFILRLLIGMAVGADYPIATSLLAEFTPRKYRGPFLGGLIVMWFVGATAAFFVGDLLLAIGPDGWRWMLLSPAIPATIFVLLRLGTPESPRWLLKKGRVNEADAIIKEYYGPQASVADLEGEPEEKENLNVRVLFRGGYLGRITYVTIFWTCAIVPLFGVYAFGPKILAALHLDGAESVGSAFISLLFLIGCVVALLLVNRMGRRPLVIWSFLLSGIALLGLGFFPNANALVILAFFAGYAVFLGGTQILTWVYPNELFPTEVRGTAVGVGSSLCRIGAAIGTYLIPISLAELGIGATMLIGAAITFAGFLASVLWAPETRGLALHDAGKLAPAGARQPDQSARNVPAASSQANE